MDPSGSATARILFLLQSRWVLGIMGMICPCRSTDRMPPSEGGDAGSIPAEGTDTRYNSSMTQKARMHIAVDCVIIVVSIVVATMLVRSGAVSQFLSSLGGGSLVGSFIAGMFFTSVFTTFPAMAVLGTIAQDEPVVLVAVLGGFGAMLGDFLIFKFIRDRMVEDIGYLVGAERGRRFRHIIHLRLFRWLVPLVGALVIASPLPDELGISMLGLSKTKTWLFLPVSFVANTFGILVIGLVARNLF